MSLPLLRLLAVGLLTTCLTAHAAVSEKEAALLVQDGQFGAAAEMYRALLEKNPASIGLRMNLADNLARDRQWSAAVAEYEAILKRQPNNAEALRGLATVRRWQGHIGAAKHAYQRARTVEPNSIDAKLGLAATYALDHDYAAAQRHYEEATKMWPTDAAVKRAATDFRHRANPRAYLYYEDDLSFRTEQLGLAVPFAGREELGVEGQRETRYLYLTGDKTYERNDAKLLYTHFFGLNHTLDGSAKKSRYSYEVPVPPGTFSSAIDTYEEYRVRYTYPVTPEQVTALRYTARPTTLVYGQSFLSHKLEIELRSAWTPRWRTLLGTGWLRDLAENPTSEADLQNYTLVKLGFEVDPTNQLTLGARYVTNPDLDNTVDSMLIAEASYSFPGPLSALLRYRADDYKLGDDQSSLYAGLRYVPSSQFWSEVGLKYVERGPSDGYYPLVSLVVNF